MNEIITEMGVSILKNYGIFGFCIVAVVVGGTWFIKKVISHFIDQINKFDNILKDLSEKNFTIASNFSEALRELTQVIDRDLAVKMDMAGAQREVVMAFDRMSEQNRSEHTKILEHVINANPRKTNLDECRAEGARGF